MKIEKGTWHYKLFARWRSLKFVGWEPYRYYEGITLCCYVKAVFLFAVPRIIFQSKVSKLTALNFLLAMIIYFEITSPIFLIVMVVISTLLLYLCGVTLVVLLGCGIAYFVTNSETSEAIIKPYFKSKKDKVCPRIYFVSRDENGEA